jgi:hypothetical protein
MQLISNVPDSFWGLFRTKNRILYIEVLMNLNEEYQYNNYFISWDACVQVISSFFHVRMINLEDEDQESDIDKTQPPATRTLNLLIKMGWLKKLEDYSQGITNIVIPDYSAVMIDAFERLYNENDDEAEVYIRNVYASVFSYLNDSREDISFLNNAMQNTRILNKSLQNMLHNMNRFFSNLLDQELYGNLLAEHLNVYVEEVVKKKYHILKTSDNFYLYKNDIKSWLREIEERTSEKVFTLDNSDENRLLLDRYTKELNLVQEISRGFDEIERRIFFMDKEHMKYVRATVTRLNYLINEDRDTKGLIIQFLNYVSSENCSRAAGTLRDAASLVHLTDLEIMSSRRFYKKRKTKSNFTAQLEPDREIQQDLTKEEILRMNRTHNKYSKMQIEEFIESGIKGDRFEVTDNTVQNDTEFEKLILAYDYSIRRNSRFEVIEEGKKIETERYRYPKITFRRKQAGA